MMSKKEQSRIHRAQMAERRIVSRTSESSWMDRSSMCRGLGRHVEKASCISHMLCALDAPGSSACFLFVLAIDDGRLIQQSLSRPVQFFVEALVQRLPKFNCGSRLRVASSFERVEMSETCICLLSSEAHSGFDVPINESGSKGGAVEELSASAVCGERQHSCEGEAPQILIEGDRDAASRVASHLTFKVLCAVTHAI